MSLVTTKIEEDLIREALIALRDRRYTLNKDYQRSAPFIQGIISRQLERVDTCIEALEVAVGERV